NPRLRDNPIVLASEGFAALTGYDIDLIVGRNCRFLQGPGTAPTSVKRLHDALARGVGITSLLLNYRRDGTPFFNLLCMLPLKDSSGAVKYFLG
ncbi:PAS domain-containing protein, partial [Leucosporidium creatinivorum]